MNRKFAYAFAMLTMFAASVVGQELTTNGDFETGDTSSWESFPTANSTFNVTSDASSGLFAGEVFNDDGGSSAVIKQANLGIGQVIAGDEVFITFDAKGATANGGVVFAEFFSEIDGGGTSSNVILGSGALPLTSDYQTFEFTTIAGADVSGGVTLQFAAIAGADAGSQAQLFVDNVSVSLGAVPEPGSMMVLGFAAFGFCVRRRR